MSTPVDHDLLLQYVHRELGGAELERARRLVAEDPAWRDAMRELLALDLALAEAVGEQAPAPRPAPRASPVRWLAVGLLAAAPAAALLLLPSAATVVVAQRVDHLGTCPTPVAGVMMGDPATDTALCAGDVLELELRPSHDAAWVSPELRLDGGVVTCPAEPIGARGVGRVRCTLGVHLRVDDLGPHTLTVLLDGEVIHDTTFRVTAP